MRPFAKDKSKDKLTGGIVPVIIYIAMVLTVLAFFWQSIQYL